MKKQTLVLALFSSIMLEAMELKHNGYVRFGVLKP
jgi:hypothetical protein